MKFIVGINIFISLYFIRSIIWMYFVHRTIPVSPSVRWTIYNIEHRKCVFCFVHICWSERAPFKRITSMRSSQIIQIHCAQSGRFGVETNKVYAKPNTKQIVCRKFPSKPNTIRSCNWKREHFVELSKAFFIAMILR